MSMQYLRKCLLLFYQSQWLIAFAAAGLVYTAPIAWGQHAIFSPLVGLVFFATYLEYNLSRLVLFWSHFSVIIKKPKTKGSDLAFLFLYLLCFCAAMFFLSAVSTSIRYVFLVSTGLTLLYSVSFAAGSLQLKGLRRFGFIKLMLIGVVWSIVSILLPAMQSGIDGLPLKIIVLCIQRCCFIIAITLPFDVRDALQDRIAGVNSLPIRLGNVMARRLSAGLLGVYVVLAFMHLFNGAFLLFASDIVVAIAAAYLILSPAFNRDSEWYYLYLDATLLLLTLCLLFVNSVFRIVCIP